MAGGLTGGFPGLGLAPGIGRLKPRGERLDTLRQPRRQFALGLELLTCHQIQVAQSTVQPGPQVFLEIPTQILEIVGDRLPDLAQHRVERV